MSKQTKGFYRFLAWFFTIVIASGTLSGCGGESSSYGPPTPTAKYGPPVYNSTSSSSAVKVESKTTKVLETL